MDPTKEKERYSRNTLRVVMPQTAAMAGRVVVGPAMRKVNTAAGLMPCCIKPLTIGKAAISVV